MGGWGRGAICYREKNTLEKEKNEPKFLFQNTRTAATPTSKKHSEYSFSEIKKAGGNGSEREKL